jgi:hypothetical protein
MVDELLIGRRDLYPSMSWSILKPCLGLIDNGNSKDSNARPRCGGKSVNI